MNGALHVAALCLQIVFDDLRVDRGCGPLAGLEGRIEHGRVRLAWRGLAALPAGRLRHALGLGFRLETALGPIRLEFGWKADREPGETPGEVYLSIGNAF